MEVIGCTTEVELQQYLCSFTQHLDLTCREAQALEVTRSPAWPVKYSLGEAVAARFVRAAKGGWTVV